ncbi:MAG: hypothetical protein QM664_05125 [Flavihumibacter sp.]
MQEAQRILAASNNGRSDFDLLLAEAELGQQHTTQPRLLKNSGTGRS